MSFLKSCLDRQKEDDSEVFYFVIFYRMVKKTNELIANYKIYKK